MIDEAEQVSNLQEIEDALLEAIGQEATPDVLQRLNALLFEVRAAIKRHSTSAAPR